MAGDCLEEEVTKTWRRMWACPWGKLDEGRMAGGMCSLS